MKKEINNKAIIIILFSNILLIAFLLIKINHLREKSNSSEVESNSIYDQNEYISSSLIAEYKSNGQRIDTSGYFFDKDNVINILNVFTERQPVLILRYFRDNCFSCYHEVLSIFAAICERNENYRIVVLTDIETPYNIRYFIRDTKISCKVISQKELDLNLPCEELGKPYCFILDNNNVAQLCHIIRSENPILFQEYLKIALNKIN